ncbi:MAG: hypothetical protein KME26_00325 [Oscillatoria princeps RMCB-10]|nr:hypothetical protein [Oscillatoria princeps RMCB-10]
MSARAAITIIGTGSFERQGSRYTESSILRQNSAGTAVHRKGGALNVTNLLQ